MDNILLFNDHYKNFIKKNKINRLVIKLADYEFEIQHKPGTGMRVLDSISSRYPNDKPIKIPKISKKLHISKQ